MGPRLGRVEYRPHPKCLDCRGLRMLFRGVGEIRGFYPAFQNRLFLKGCHSTG